MIATETGYGRNLPGSEQGGRRNVSLLPKYKETLQHELNVQIVAAVPLL